MTQSIRFLVFVVFLLLFSLWQSCSELRYSMSGVEADGRPSEVLREVRKDSGEPTGRFQVKYTYKADKKSHSGSIIVKEDEVERMEAAGRIPLIYLPSDPERHVVKGHRAVWAVVLLCAMLALALLFCLRIWREAQEDLRKSRRP